MKVLIQTFFGSIKYIARLKSSHIA